MNPGIWEGLSNLWNYASSWNLELSDRTELAIFVAVLVGWGVGISGKLERICKYLEDEDYRSRRSLENAWQIQKNLDQIWTTLDDTNDILRQQTEKLDNLKKPTYNY